MPYQPKPGPQPLVKSVPKEGSGSTRNKLAPLSVPMVEELARNQFLREELRREFKLRETAELGRDIIRAHAQAALVKYRAQDDLLEELDKLLKVLQANPQMTSPWQQGFILALELVAEKRAAVKAT